MFTITNIANRHKYAPISGSVEVYDETPLATAWREIKEETSLTSTSLRLFRQGKPYSFVDTALGREWTINPFAYILRPDGEGEAGIRLDWEHESYQWFDLDAITAASEGEEILQGQGVPRLLESLRRVWFDIDIGSRAGKVLSDGLRLLQEDHESGARQLASRALDVFCDTLGALDETAQRDVWWRNAQLVGWHLWKNGRESMGAPILSVVLSSLDIIERKLPEVAGSDGGRLPDGFAHSVVADINEFAQRRKESTSKIGDAFTLFLRERFPAADKPIKILTLSSSSTITSCIAHALTLRQTEDHNRLPPLDIRVLESRPLFEGAKMADKIALLSHVTATSSTSPATPNTIITTVSVYTDASAAVAAKDVDIVLLGADLIDNHGNVSNKTGSLPAVLAARHVSSHVQTVVLAEKEKVLPFNPPRHDEENDPCEMTQSWSHRPRVTSGSNMMSTVASSVLPGVQVKNVYFEWVGAELVDHYVTEDGVLSSEEIAEWAADVKQKTDRFFADL